MKLGVNWSLNFGREVVSPRRHRRRQGRCHGSHGDNIVVYLRKVLPEEAIVFGDADASTAIKDVNWTGAAIERMLEHVIAAL